MFSVSELQSLRRDVAASLLTQVAEVKRRGTSGDGMGGHRQVPLTPEPSLACRATRMRTPRTVVEGGRPVVVANWEVRLGDASGERAPEELDVKPADEILVGWIRYKVVDTDKGRAEAPCLVCETLRVS